MTRCRSEYSKRLGIALLVVAAVLSTVSARASETEVRVMTFNIRYGRAADGPNHWDLRRELVFETLRTEAYDFIGLQEALRFQVEEIRAALPEHGLLYRTREVDPEEGEGCAILFRSDRWKLDPVEQGTFWLSETPEVAGSRSWDTSLPRIATWGRFTEIGTGTPIYVFNTHFDHRGEVARVRSGELLHRRAVQQAGGATFVVMGDFNAGENNPAIAALRGAPDSEPRLVDSFRVLYPDETVVYTFNGWGDRTEGDKIDSIFVREGTGVLDARILRLRFDGRTPSDHEPVSAVLRLSPRGD